MTHLLIGVGAAVALSFALALLLGSAGKPTARMQPKPLKNSKNIGGSRD